jgi:uncharacterized protein YraI
MRFAYILAAALLAATLPHKAEAFWMSTTEGHAASSVNLRAGPSTKYPALDMLRKHEEVRIIGCLPGWDWCDVRAGSMRGWVSAKYLHGMMNGRDAAIMKYGPQLGIREIMFHERSYWAQNYYGRDFYQKRYGWERPAYDRPEYWDRGSQYNRTSNDMDRSRGETSMSRDRNMVQTQNPDLRYSTQFHYNSN